MKANQKRLTSKHPSNQPNAQTQSRTKKHNLVSQYNRDTESNSNSRMERASDFTRNREVFYQPGMDEIQG